MKLTPGEFEKLLSQNAELRVVDGRGRPASMSSQYAEIPASMSSQYAEIPASMSSQYAGGPASMSDLMPRGGHYAQIEMRPFGKARPRVTSRGTYMPKEYQASREALKKAFGPVAVSAPFGMQIVAVMKMPKKLSKAARAAMWGSPCSTKPDLDNIAGAVMDALLPDDAAVVDLQCYKVWGDTDLLSIALWNVRVEPWRKNLCLWLDANI